MNDFSRRFPFILFLLLSADATGLAAETHWQFHSEGIVQYRDLNQNGFDTNTSLTEGYALADVGVTTKWESFFLEVKPQFRGAQSPGLNRQGPAATGVGMPPRWLNSRRLIQSSFDRVLYADWDRLNLRWQHSFENSDMELSVGRRPISLGVLRLFPVWNKLTLPLIFLPGPEWIDNPDSVLARYQLERTSFRFIEVQGHGSERDSLVLGEAKLSMGSAEAQILAGDWGTRATVGLAVSFDSWGATWRAEGLHFENRRESFKTDSSFSSAGTDQIGFGIERALNAEWTAVLEYYQQSECATEQGTYGLTPFTEVQVLNGCRYVFPYLDYQINSLWRLSFGSLIQAVDFSGMGVIDINHSVSDNTTLELKLKQSFGQSGSEFGSARYSDLLGRKAGAQSTLYLLLATTI